MNATTSVKSGNRTINNAEDNEKAIKLYSSEVDKFKMRNFEKNSAQLTDRNIEQLVASISHRKKSYQHVAKEFKD